LKTAWDTIIAPKEAFASIRVVPTWGWALAIAILLSAFGAYLAVPAFQHAFAADWPRMAAQNHQLSELPPDRQQSILALQIQFLKFVWVFNLVGIPIVCLINAIVMLIFDKLGKGDGSFSRYWAAACNIAIVYGLQSLILGIITIVRGPESYASTRAVVQSVPSLAFFAPDAGIKLSAFLTTINVFTVWSVGLVIFALAVVGRTRSFQAWLGGLAAYIFPMLAAVWGAR
jgi:hypothetical protein